MSTVGPPFSVFPIPKVMLGFTDDNLWCRSWSTQYDSYVSSHTKPKASSKDWHDSIGRYMKGWVESINESIGDGSSDLIDPLAKLEIIDRKPTTRSRVTSGASLKEIPLS